jgi:AcrR family transcriptional regulator
MANKRVLQMEQNRQKLIAAGRKAFAEHGYADASMDELTASVGLTRGALYHNFGDKRGLLAAVVHQIDEAMAAEAQALAAHHGDLWQRLLKEGEAYIEMALRQEVQRIVLLDGPAVLGDPSRWPSQNACLQATMKSVRQLIEAKIFRPVDVEAASRLLSGAALNAALFVAASDDPATTLPKAIESFRAMAEGFLTHRPTGIGS